ncbi:abc-type polar amino acid transport system, atpase component [Liquorilactobacillus satsumensis DSM 16230 = JCM 12392]|uniref:Abc-type polar amino acid transport system, atpase component n=1 Tax=Liquorilactobacillus satsumensis DSM 16230 = JCM 12392 TaxID=1423801 RepID=A0A0R1UV79_9LACO|nr:abc-type polar amino acid transport system, atpase component [Liquorilactobacillus satsumensis DSM 16230 = JCM 12392]
MQFGKKKVLNNINLEIPEGSVTAIVGPSGSGKTTLLRTLNLLQLPSDGSIAIDDAQIDAQHIERAKIKQIRTKSTMVFQQFNLFKNLTALENVMSPLVYNKKTKLNEARKTALAVLKDFGLEKIAAQYPVTLSGGQQQRVSIARAIVAKPKVVLFDEPTSALDPELVAGVLNAIAKLAEQDITMVIVTHEIEFARQIADQAIFVEDGEIVDQGVAKELLSTQGNGRIANFVNSLVNQGQIEVAGN